MTQKQRVAAAKYWVDALALGRDPRTGEVLAKDSTLNRVDTSRCLFFVSGLLQEILDNGGSVLRRSGRKLPFALPVEQRAQFPFSETPVTVTMLCRALNEMVDPNVYRRLRTTVITDWLLQFGFLEIAERPDGTPFRTPTARGRSVGLTTEERQGTCGSYSVTLYCADAQHFVLDNLDAILDPAPAAVF